MPLAGPSRGVSGRAPQEVAAVVAVLALLDTDQRRHAASTEGDAEVRVDPWVLASRLRGRRATLERGPWRLAPRLGSRRTS
ncbi:MAG: hypothetical protein ACRDV9_02680 [Acidimicrobiia bacterium]